MSVRLLFSLLMLILLSSCQKDGGTAKADSSKVPASTQEGPSFQTALKEPLSAHTFSLDRWYDFHPKHYQAIDISDSSRYASIRILHVQGREEWANIQPVLGRFQELEALKISHCDFSSSSALSGLMVELSRLPHVKKLFLNSCQIRSLPEEIGLLDSLQSLDLSFNQLIDLPEALYELTTLEYLRLYNNTSFKKFSPSLGKLAKLRTLDFAGSNVYELPASLGQCRQLIHITGNACKIRSLPPELCACKELAYINLSYNRIDSLPVEIGNLQKLSSLSLGGNRLESLPLSFGKLKKLSFCGLGLNRFQRFPLPLLGCSGLFTLWLHGNNFREVPDELSSLKKLRHLLIDESKMRDSSLIHFQESRPEVRVIDEGNR